MSAAPGAAGDRGGAAPASLGGRALVREAGGVTLRSRPAPGALGRGEVLVRVAFAGVCRTDVYVAEGRIAVADGRVLGHEFAGRVAAVGAGVSGLRPGQAVTADPRLPCGACAGCEAGEAGEAKVAGTAGDARAAGEARAAGGARAAGDASAAGAASAGEEARAAGAASAAGERCSRPRFLGVDVDGAFGDWVRLPAAAIVPLPPGLDLRVGAYVEPVAATLAVLRTGISPSERGLVYGAGRIAALAYDVLRARGFEQVEQRDPAGGALAADAYDFAVETGLSAEGLRALVGALRPRGRLVLKSRSVEALPVEFGPLVRKELSLVAANYGSFAEAAELLARGGLDLRERFGPPRPLSDFAAVFEGESRGGERKAMFRLEGEGG